MEKHELLEGLGNVADGVVFKARNPATGDIVAIRSRQEVEDLTCSAIRDITFLKELRHDNLVRVYDVFRIDGRLYLVVEDLTWDLKKLLDAAPLNSNLRLLKVYMWQILEGIAFCHSRWILHRDLKPQNILIDQSGTRLKLADFGMARRHERVSDRMYKHEVGYLWYLAPEILLGSKTYSTAVDIWSAGCILVEIVTNKALFPGKSVVEQLYMIIQLLGTPDESMWAGCSFQHDCNKDTFAKRPPQDLAAAVPALGRHGADLLARMLVYAPQHRITASDALNHTFFDEVRSQMRANGLQSGGGGLRPAVDRLRWLERAADYCKADMEVSLRLRADPDEIAGLKVQLEGTLTAKMEAAKAVSAEVVARARIEAFRSEVKQLHGELEAARKVAAQADAEAAEAQGAAATASKELRAVQADTAARDAKEVEAARGEAEARAAEMAVAVQRMPAAEAAAAAAAQQCAAAAVAKPEELEQLVPSATTLKNMVEMELSELKTVYGRLVYEHGKACAERTELNGQLIEAKDETAKAREAKARCEKVISALQRQLAALGTEPVAVQEPPQVPTPPGSNWPIHVGSSRRSSGSSGLPEDE